MIVITKDSEKKLFQDLKKLKKTHPAQGCFIFETSRLNVIKQDFFEFFLKKFQEIPESYMAHIYVCRNADIFFLLEGFTKRHFNDFLNALFTKFQDKKIFDFAKIYEIGKDWYYLENICHKKISFIEQETKKKETEAYKASAEKTTFDILSSLDPAKISTISERRKKRKNSLVLIADDDQLSRVLAGNVLREHYTPAFAKDGKTAVLEFVEYAPDAVFLDIGMPDLSGHDVLECLFQIDPDAYVIMFSGRKDEKNMLRALETGAQGFVGKPFTREKLYHYVEKSPFTQQKKDILQH